MALPSLHMHALEQSIVLKEYTEDSFTTNTFLAFAAYNASSITYLCDYIALYKTLSKTSQWVLLYGGLELRAFSSSD